MLTQQKRNTTASLLINNRQFCIICHLKVCPAPVLHSSKTHQHSSRRSRKTPFLGPGYHYVFGVNFSSNATSDFVVRRCVLEIQDGSQITGSSNISETMTYIIKIPTTNLWHSTMANSQEVYMGDSYIPIMSNNRKWRPKPEILISLKLRKVQLKVQRHWV